MTPKEVMSHSYILEAFSLIPLTLFLSLSFDVIDI